VLPHRAAAARLNDNHPSSGLASPPTDGERGFGVAPGLKIDGSLVESRIDHAMVAAINEIGHIMGMKTIGEHAHNAAVVSRLRKLGIDAAQGFAFGQPRPLDELRLRASLRQ
jgi:EAL domain-containing protein (putative c-di-GMP-specific phosphodiesterase class I)